MIKLTVYDIPSSNNKSQGSGGVGKALAYNQEKRRWTGYFQAIRSQMRDQLQGKGLPLSEATIITIYNFTSETRRDPDNYSGKMIHDGLTAAAFIRDDSFKEINILPLATFGNKKASVEIYILQGKRLGDIASMIINGEGDLICGAI